MYFIMAFCQHILVPHPHFPFICTSTSQLCLDYVPECSSKVTASLRPLLTSAPPTLADHHLQEDVPQICIPSQDLSKKPAVGQRGPAGDLTSCWGTAVGGVPTPQHARGPNPKLHPE